MPITPCSAAGIAANAGVLGCPRVGLNRAPIPSASWDAGSPRRVRHRRTALPAVSIARARTDGPIDGEQVRGPAPTARPETFSGGARWAERTRQGTLGRL